MPTSSRLDVLKPRNPYAGRFLDIFVHPGGRIIVLSALLAGLIFAPLDPWLKGMTVTPTLLALLRMLSPPKKADESVLIQTMSVVSKHFKPSCEAASVSQGSLSRAIHDARPAKMFATEGGVAQAAK